MGMCCFVIGGILSMLRFMLKTLLIILKNMLL